MSIEEVKIESEILLVLVHWARRYCDGRSTYAPSSFNQAYKYLLKKHPELMKGRDQFDHTLTGKGEFFPYAQDGMYDEKTNRYDARW